MKIWNIQIKKNGLIEKQNGKDKRQKGKGKKQKDEESSEKHGHSRILKLEGKNLGT